MNTQRIVEMNSPKSCARCSRPLNNINKSEWSLCYLCQTDFGSYSKNANSVQKLTEWIDGGGIKVARCIKCNVVMPVKEATAQEGRCAQHFEFLGKKRASLVVARRALHATQPKRKINMMPKKTETTDTKWIEGKIEKKIPIPSVHGNIIPVYPWDKMVIGDSFWMNKPSIVACKLTYNMGRQLKLKFVTRKDGKGTRVWRVK